MRGQKLVFLLMLFVLGIGSALVLRGPVYAWKYECCMCMACSHYLCHYCMGESTTCGYCTDSEVESAEARAPLSQETVDIRAVRKSERATVLESDFVQSFLIRMAGDPARRNLLLTLAKHPDYKLTVWCPGSERRQSSVINLVSQIKTEHDE